MFGNHKFISFQYLCGINNDFGIKEIKLEICKDGLNFLHSKSNEIEFLSYEYITNVYTFEEDDTEFSLKRGLTLGIIGSLIGGADLGALAFGFGGWKKTKEFVLEIEIYNEEHDNTGSLYLLGSKNKVINFANDLKCTINQFKR